MKIWINRAQHNKIREFREEFREFACDVNVIEHVNTVNGISYHIEITTRLFKVLESYGIL